MNSVLVTGGAGFIGANLSRYFLEKSIKVRVYDNLFRPGSEKNLTWLKETFPDKVEVWNNDIRDFESLLKATEGVDAIFHLAAQVAVTTSMVDPRTDFDINASGTLNILEAVRRQVPTAPVIFASTNKVYGGLDHIATERIGQRYAYQNRPFGIDELQSLDFHSPYGCSKGCADQYVRDYHRIYGLKTVVLRQSCIYGCRQFGIEDQGWVAWFTISAVKNRQINIYGDGKQVRDILFIDDLINCFERCLQYIDRIQGEIYNIGGGHRNAVSLLEVIAQLEKLRGDKIKVEYKDWRPGDQKIYISNINKAKTDFDWSPTIGVSEGLKRLFLWVSENKGLF